jgi:hypothetical protein
VSWLGLDWVADKSVDSVDSQRPRRLQPLAVLWISLWNMWVDWHAMPLARQIAAVNANVFDSQ